MGVWGLVPFTVVLVIIAVFVAFPEFYATSDDHIFWPDILPRFAWIIAIIVAFYAVIVIAAWIGIKVDAAHYARQKRAP